MVFFVAGSAVLNSACQASDSWAAVMLGMVLAAKRSAELVMPATLVGAAAAVWDARGVAGLPGSPEIADPLFSVVGWLRSVQEGARGAHLAARCAPVQAN